MSQFSRRGSSTDNFSLKSKLESTKITKWTPPELGVPAKNQQTESIWEWIQKNGEGDTFELKGQAPSIPEQTVNRASENSKAGSHLSPRVNDTNDQTINQSAEAHLTAKENGLISPNIKWILLGLVPSLKSKNILIINVDIHAHTHRETI